MSDSPRSVLERFFVLGGANIAGSGIGFVSVLVLIRTFDAAGFGMIQLAMTILSYGMIATLFGTDLYAVKSAAGDRDGTERLISSVVTLRLALGAAAYLILFATVWLVPQLRDVRLLAALFGLAVFNSAITLRWVPQALHRTHILAEIELETQLLWLGSLLLVLRFVPELWVVAVCRLGVEVLVAGRLWLWIRVGAELRPRSPSWADLRRLLTASAPIGGAQLLRSLTLGTDVLLLGLLVARTDLGHYAAAFRIFSLLMAVNTSYFVILLPRLAERARRSGPELAQEVSRSMRTILPLAAVAGAAVIATASPLLALLFGDSFAGAAMSLQLLTVVTIVNLARHHYRQVLLTTGRQTLDMRQTAMAVIVHLVSKLALIPWLGISGAALGTLAGELFLLGLQWHSARDALSRINPMQKSHA